MAADTRLDMRFFAATQDRRSPMLKSSSSGFTCKNEKKKQKQKYIKGVLHLLPQKAPKLACFMLHLKIINIFLINNLSIL